MTISNRYQFGGNRELAIKRDKESCVECGMTRKQHRVKFKRDITVDHIDGTGRNTPPPLRDNRLDNLRTLCLPCHGRKDLNRPYKMGDTKIVYAREWLRIKQERSSKRKRQVQVTGKRFRNQLFSLDGEEKTLEQWCKLADCGKSTFYQRFYAYGWSLDRCLIKPRKKGIINV